MRSVPAHGQPREQYESGFAILVSCTIPISLIILSIDDLTDHLASKYQVEPIVLSDNVEIAEHGETRWT